MKKILLLSLLSLLTFRMQAQTVTVSPLTFGPVVCNTNDVVVPLAFTVNESLGSFNSTNYFTAELSNGTGSFASPTAVGTLVSQSAGLIFITLPNTLPAGNNYLIRIKASDPAVLSTNSRGPIRITNTSFGNPAAFGSGIWNAYAYAGAIITNPAAAVYKGFYTDNNVDFSTETKWAKSTSPSKTTGYSGCAVPDDNHSVVYKRAGFNCDFYQVSSTYDEKFQFYVNGVLQKFSNVGGTDPNVWVGRLGIFSTVEFRTEETTGDSYSSLTFTPIDVFPQYSIAVCRTNPNTILSPNPVLLTIPGIDFVWTRPDGVSFSGPDLTVPPNLAGTYVLEIDEPSNPACGSNSASVDITFKPDVVAAISPANPVVCPGDPTLLTASGGTGYVWKDAGGTVIGNTALLTVSPLVNTAYTVEVTSGSCTASKTVNVSTAGVIVAAISPANPVICPGDPTLLTASGGTSYVWKDAGGTVIGNLASLTVSPLVNTTYTAEITNNCGTASQTANVTTGGVVGNPAVFGNGVWNVYGFNGSSNYRGYYTEPALSFGSDFRWGFFDSPSSASGWQGCPVDVDNHTVVCKRTNFPCGYYEIGINNHFEDAYLRVNGISVWSEAGGVNGGNPSVWKGYLNAASTLEFGWINNTGISSGAISVPNISPFTAIPSSVSTCAGVPVTLTATVPSSTTIGAPLATISWSVVSGGATLSNLTSSSVDVTPTSNAVIQVKADYNGCSVTRNINVNIPPLSLAATVSSTNGCPGDLLTLQATGATTYQWSDGSGTVIGNTASLNVSPASTTTYKVEGGNGCITDTKFVTVNVTPSPADTLPGINEWKAYVYNNSLISAPAGAALRGFYTEKDISFDSGNRYNPSSSNPSAVLPDISNGSSGYAGCSVNQTGHSVTYKRKGFNCGFYNIAVAYHQDGYRLYVNGVLESSSNVCCTSVPGAWSGFLDPNSTVEFIWESQGSNGSRGALSIAFSVGSASLTVWNGKAGTSDWNNPFNWCPVVPDATTDVIIPGGGVSVFPAINEPGDACRNIMVATGASLTIGSGQTLSVYGNWDSSMGNLTCLTGSQVSLLGNTGITTLAMNAANRFENLTVQKTGQSVTMQSPVSVFNQLSLDNIELNLNSQTLTLLNPASTAIVRLNNAYIRSETNAANNPSRVCWRVGNSTGSYEFPFGTSFTEYLPVIFNKNTAAATDLCLSTRATGTNNLPWATGVTNMSGASATSANVVDRWWDISSTLSPLPAPGADIILTYRGIENTTPFGAGALLSIQHWESTKNDWEAPYNPATSGVITGTGTASATGVLKFSPFVISTTIAPLPINFLSLRAAYVGNKVRLDWRVATDDARTFTIERSLTTDGFTPLTNPGDITENGRNYIGWDNQPWQKEIVYYRIKAIDEKGVITYSRTEAVRLTATVTATLTVNPNPANGSDFQISLKVKPDSRGTVIIADLLGRKVYETLYISDTDGFYRSESMPALLPGLYVIYAYTDSKILQQKILIR
jgi:hypothetical protein